METIILQDVVHLPVSFDLILQSQIMDRDVKVEPVNLYCLNLYNRHGKLISTAPQVNELFILEQVPELTQYSHSDNSCLLAYTTTAHASRQAAEKRMVWHCQLAHVGLKDLKILPNVIDNASQMSGKCICKSCIKCKLAREHCTPNTTSHATRPLPLVHSDICSLLATPIGGGQYVLLCLFVCNHIAFSRWRPWHIPYIFPPRFFRTIKKQKQSRESSSPLNKRNRQKTTSTFTPPHHSTPRDLSSPPPQPLR